MGQAGATKPVGNTGYSVARPQGRCAVSGRAIAPGERFFAALRETPVGLERLDLAAECWEGFDKRDLLAYWQATMPEPDARRPMFVDDTVLCELFERLADVEEPAKRNFRFVLGLILMRKRLLSYEGTRHTENGEWWVVKLKGREQPLEMLNPHLDEAQTREVSGQLSEVLNAEA